MNPNKYGVHDEHREACAWNIGDPEPKWAGDLDILSLRTRGGVTVSHYLAYQGYQFADDQILQLAISEMDSRTVASEYERGVVDRANIEVENNG